MEQELDGFAWFYARGKDLAAKIQGERLAKHIAL